MILLFQRYGLGSIRFLFHKDKDYNIEKIIFYNEYGDIVETSSRLRELEDFEPLLIQGKEPMMKRKPDYSFNKPFLVYHKKGKYDTFLKADLYLPIDRYDPHVIWKGERRYHFRSQTYHDIYYLKLGIHRIKLVRNKPSREQILVDNCKYEDRMVEFLKDMEIYSPSCYMIRSKEFKQKNTEMVKT